MSTLRTQSNGDITVVYFKDSRILDDPRIQEIGDELMEIAGASANGNLLLNFDEVKFMSSAMLGKLMMLNKECKANQINLKLSNITPDIMEVFKMMRLNRVLDIYKDESKALASF